MSGRSSSKTRVLVVYSLPEKDGSVMFNIQGKLVERLIKDGSLTRNETFDRDLVSLLARFIERIQRSQ